MRRAIMLLGLLILPGGCAGWRPPPSVVVAPDPVVYPAPAGPGRFLPWINPGQSTFLG